MSERREREAKPSIDLDDLIAEAREWPRDGINEARTINDLADALESVRAERDAALARIAELEAEIKTRTEGFEEVLAGRQASPEEWSLLGRLETAEARIAEAAKLHRKRKYWETDKSYIFVCGRCRHLWPCDDARILGLNEGENDD